MRRYLFFFSFIASFYKFGLFGFLIPNERLFLERFFPGMFEIIRIFFVGFCITVYCHPNPANYMCILQILLSFNGFAVLQL